MKAATARLTSLVRSLGWDEDTWLIVAVTLAGFVGRWIFAIGYALGDDLPYTEIIAGILERNYPEVGPIGQYTYRPAWTFPLAATVKFFGWGVHGLVLYPLLTGSLVPLLTAWWLRRHLPAGSRAPLLCAALLAVYPTLFIDSLMLVNETPLICLCLLCVNLFGVTWARLFAAPPSLSATIVTALGGLATGLAFAGAYQVKASAMPLLGVWLVTELGLQLARQPRPWTPRGTPLLSASVAFLLPIVGSQVFYFIKTGHPLGNFVGEARLYDAWIPPEYYEGRPVDDGALWEYPKVLFLPYGYEEWPVLLHGIWAWIAAALVLAVGLFWRWLPRGERTIAAALAAGSLGLFLFFEFWPARLTPLYLPNCFTGRVWRYIDVLAPSLAALIAVVLTLPGVFERRAMATLRAAVLCAGFAVAGHTVAIRHHEFADRASDLARARATKGLEAYWPLRHIVDVDAFGHLRVLLDWPEPGRFDPRFSTTFDLRGHPPACLWTGGSRRDGLDGDAALNPEKIKYIGGTMHLVHTWPAIARPWRSRPLQLWRFEPEPAPAPPVNPPTAP